MGQAQKIHDIDRLETTHPTHHQMTTPQPENSEQIIVGDENDTPSSPHKTTTSISVDNPNKINVKVGVEITKSPQVDASVNVTIVEKDTNGEITRSTNVTQDSNSTVTTEDYGPISEKIDELLINACKQNNPDMLYTLVTTGNCKRFVKREIKDKQDEYRWVLDKSKIQLRKGVNINCTDSDGNTPIHHCAMTNSENCAAILYRCGCCNLNAQNSKGESPVILAVKHNNIQVLHLLLRFGADHTLMDNNGLLAMQWAVLEKKEGCCNVLIEHGADVSMKYKRDERVFRKFTLHKFNSVSQMDPNPEDDEKYDEYGFEKEPITVDPKNKKENQRLKKYLKQRELMRKKEKSRVQKWKKMIASIRAQQKKHPNKPITHRKLKSRVRKGIPNSIRGEAWKLLLPIEKLKKENPGVYSQYMMAPAKNQKDARQIDIDILRCFRKHKLYAERYGKGQIALFNVLKAFINFYPQLGYCQGMAPITALLLMYLDEEDAFWALVHLMRDPKYDMQSIFAVGFPRLLECYYVHDQLVKTFLPKLWKHFEKEGVQTTDYTTRWYMMLMLENLPFDVALRMWDIFFSEGNKVVFSETLALLRMYDQDLLQMNFENIMQFFGSFERRPIDIDMLVSLTVKKKVKHKVIKKYIEEYKKQQEEFLKR